MKNYIITILSGFVMSLFSMQALQAQEDTTNNVLQDSIEMAILINTPYNPITDTLQVSIDSLISYGKTYLGYPYRSTKRSPWPMDCSGYVAMLYGTFGVHLPRGSGNIAKLTKTIPLSEARPGDLIFFKGHNKRANRIGHVALIIEKTEHGVIMMHSTNSKGIIVEPYPSGYYYVPRFVKVGRL